jgi:hypothetical protein
MTTLGKILVFVNLVFSLITGALIIMVFITRTNWHEGYQKLERNNAALQDRNTRLVAELKATRDEADKAVKAAEAERDKAKDELAAVTKEKDDFKSKFLAEQRRAQSETATAVVSVAELERRRKEVALLEKQVQDFQNEMAKLQEEFKKQRDISVKNQLEADSLRDRNANLVQQVQELVKEMDKRRTGGGATVVAGGLANNPPPEDVRGVVKAVDPGSGLVTISIGSDAGISVNNTLEAFRFKPKPTYLGRIQILDVRHHEAVGKLISTQRRGLIQAGDEVASRIVGSER